MPESNVSKQIDIILNRRKEKAKALYARMEQLQELERAVSGISRLPQMADSIEDPGMQKKCKDLLKQVVVPKTLNKELREAREMVKSCISRFERESLNIATIGMARQGKSTLLQAIGNLDNKVIPAFDAGDCTGAVSVIYNDPNMQPGQVRAVLTFRSKEEMVQIVESYMTAISPEYLASHPVAFDEIGDIELGDLERLIEEGDSKRKTMLDHLSRIVDDFFGVGDNSAYPVRDLCGSAPRVLTDPDEIQKYVAQNNGKKKTDPERKNFYSYLAVKQADIYCRFRADVGKLVMVDTIGVGDTQLGIEDAMLDTVENKCDAAIVMTKPAAGIRKEDNALYESLRDRFKSRDIKKWLFYLANVQKGYNENAVDSFVSDIRSKNFAVAWCKKIDCSDKDQVQNEFLLPMLESLFESMESIDNVYVAQIEEKCRTIREKLTNQIAAFPEAASLDPGTVISMEVNKLGRQCYREMKTSLSKQRSKWYALRNKPNATLWNEVKDILGGLDQILPSPDALQKLMDDAGGIEGFQMWEIPLNYVRNEITDQFIAIDGLMEDETLAFKNELVRDLYHSLKNLAGEVAAAPEDEDAPAEESDMAAWLWEVMEPLLRGKPEYNQIYSGLQFLNRFEFNVRAQLIQEVRNQLRIINPMTVDYYMQPNHKFDRSNVGAAVHFYMTSRIAILEDNLCHALAKMNKMPNQAFYAAAEEFYDRMTFASDLKNGKFIDMSEIWGEFFTQYSQLLWASEMDRHKAVEVVMDEYKRYCEMLRTKLAALA